MNRLHVKVIKPCEMDEEQKASYVALHKQFISLDENTLLDYLHPRDFVLMYYDKAIKKLVATVGIQLIHFDNEALIYFGNTVIDAEYKYEGCVGHAYTKYALKLFFAYPHKKLYWCGLASSSGALEYAIRHRPSWPDPQEPTPSHVTQLCMQALESIGIDNYRVENGNIIASNLSDKVMGNFHLKPEPSSPVSHSYFNAINPGAEKGEQIFFLVPCTLKGTLDFAIHAFRSNLKKHPQLYRKIVKYREIKPRFALFLLVFTLVRAKF